MFILRRFPNEYSGMAWDYLKGNLLKSDHARCIAEFEKQYAVHLGLPEVVCTSYGCHALSIALDYFKIEGNKKVILPTYTAKVVERVLIEKGIQYVTVDIDESTATVSIAELRKIALEECSAIIITHLFGIVVQKSVIDFCREKGLIVIEDCAHAHGARFEDGTFAGTCGDVGFFSFGYAKIINTYTGGLLVTRNPDLIQYARHEISRCRPPSWLRVFQRLAFANIERMTLVVSLFPLVRLLLRSEKLISTLKNLLNSMASKHVTNFFQYTGAQALVGLRQLDELTDNLNERREIACRYERKLRSGTFLTRRAGDVYYNLVVIVPNAAAVRRKLIRQGVDAATGSAVMEPIGDTAGRTGCRFASWHYLQLPFFRGLSADTIDSICGKIDDAVKSLGQVDEARNSCHQLSHDERVKPTFL